jgi:hypothetical protein
METGKGTIPMVCVCVYVHENNCMPTIVLILRLQCNLVYEQDTLRPKCARSITLRQNTQTDVHVLPQSGHKLCII